MEAVISANKFLDLLCCVIPAASDDETRKYICAVQLEIIAQEYAIRAVATNGAVLSVAQRELGFSTAEQNDFEDIEARKKVKDTTWLISTIDTELLIISLKKLGVKRGKEDETGGRYYIAIRELGEEGKQKLSISILGLSHVVLEPDLIKETYPDWKKLVPKKTYAEIDSISFDLRHLNTLNKCWGCEKIFMSFFNKGQITKVNRNTLEEEKIKDFILLMPLIEDRDRLEAVNQQQMNLI